MAKGTFRKTERGAAVAEFAVAALFFFTLLIGIIEFGQAFSQYQAFQGAAREGARVAAVREPPGVVRARVIEAANPFNINEVGASGVMTVDIADSALTTCDSTTIGVDVTSHGHGASVVSAQVAVVCSSRKTVVWDKSTGGEKIGSNRPVIVPTACSAVAVTVPPRP